MRELLHKFSYIILLTQNEEHTMVRQIIEGIAFFIGFILVFPILGYALDAYLISFLVALFGVGGFYLHRTKGAVLKQIISPFLSAQLPHAALIAPEDMERINQVQYDARRFRQMKKEQGDLIAVGKPKLWSVEPKHFLENKEVCGLFMNFAAKHLEDLGDELRDGKLDWNNEQCQMFFSLTGSKYKISQQNTIAAVIYIALELEYITLRDSLQTKQPTTFEELLHEMVLYDIYIEHTFDPITLERYARENNITLPRFSSLGKAYEKKREEIRLATFEKNLREDSERRTTSIEQQIRQATREEYFDIASQHELSVSPEDYQITGPDHSRDSRIDRYYKAHFSYVLSSTFDGQCCKCGEGMQQLEFDHFWMPKSQVETRTQNGASTRTQNRATLS